MFFCEMHLLSHAHLFARDLENVTTGQSRGQLEANTPLLTHPMHSRAELSVRADTPSVMAG